MFHGACLQRPSLTWGLSPQHVFICAPLHLLIFHSNSRQARLIMSEIVYMYWPAAPEVLFLLLTWASLPTQTGSTSAFARALFGALLAISEQRSRKGRITNTIIPCLEVFVAFMQLFLLNRFTVPRFLPNWSLAQVHSIPRTHMHSTTMQTHVPRKIDLNHHLCLHSKPTGNHVVRPCSRPTITAIQRWSAAKRSPPASCFVPPSPQLKLEQVFMFDTRHVNLKISQMFLLGSLTFAAIFVLILYLGVLFARNASAPLLVRAISTLIKLVLGVLFIPIVGLLLVSRSAQTHALHASMHHPPPPGPNLDLPAP